MTVTRWRLDDTSSYMTNILLSHKPRYQCGFNYARDNFKHGKICGNFFVISTSFNRSRSQNPKQRCVQNYREPSCSQDRSQEVFSLLEKLQQVSVKSTPFEEHCVRCEQQRQKNSPSQPAEIFGRFK